MSACMINLQSIAAVAIAQSMLNRKCLYSAGTNIGGGIPFNMTAETCIKPMQVVYGETPLHAITNQLFLQWHVETIFV